jgi:Tfp pilus assembly protein PilF
MIRLAQFYERRGETEEAIEAYRQALERNPMERGLQERVEELERETGS